MSLLRAGITACGFGLLLSILCFRSITAGEIAVGAAAAERPRANVRFEIAPAPAAPLVMALLDTGAIHTIPTRLRPNDSLPPWPVEPMSRAEPFGLLTLQAPPGALWTKWEKVEADIQAEAPALARCRANIRRCSAAAARFVAIVKQAASRYGRTRLELVNERVNTAFHYTTDMAQWNVSDLWSAPLNPNNKGSFDTGLGDCEDYAIAKYVALREAGTPSEDLRLLMVRDNSARTYHAVLAARQDGKWLMLDNRWSRLIEENEAQFFTPLFALGADGVKRFTTNDDESARPKPRKRLAPTRVVAAKAA